MPASELQPAQPTAVTRTLRGPKRRSRWVQWAEFWSLRMVMGVLRRLPRRAAQRLGASAAQVAWILGRHLRRVGERNLALAFPEKSPAERDGVLREVYRSLGRHLAEFCQMSTHTKASASALIRYEGLEHFLAARARRRGVLVLTGHLGAWELSSFFHSLVGYPMSLVIRRLDNPRVDALVNRVRCLHGNRVIHKDDFARGILSAMHRGETVGILMDTNMTPPQGVFVPFFGVEACTASGLARIALRTEAAVLPGFLLWHEDEAKYVLHFGPELQLVRTGDAGADALANTALFTATLEAYIRRFPGQWLWLHRRWKTRPPGEAGLYA